MVADKWVEEMLGYIADINPNEIASHIADGNLKEWVCNWAGNFRKLVMQIKRCYEEDLGWIRLLDEEPLEGEGIQILGFEDNSDYPYVYVDFGFRIDCKDGKDKWVVNNELIGDRIIAWKPLSKALTMEQVREKGFFRKRL